MMSFMILIIIPCGGATEFKQLCHGPTLWTGRQGEAVEKWEPGLTCKYNSGLQGVVTYDGNVQ